MPDGYLEALQRLALALAASSARTGDDAVLVGGAAVTLYTAGWSPSGDFDLVAASTAVFDAVMAGQGFRPDEAGPAGCGSATITRIIQTSVSSRYPAHYSMGGPIRGGWSAWWSVCRAGSRCRPSGT